MSSPRATSTSTAPCGWVKQWLGDSDDAQVASAVVSITREQERTPMTIEVVGAVITRAGQVLAARRGPAGALAGRWEFPGGKVEPGETPREALTREIHEELRCHVEVGEQVERTVHAYEFATIDLTTFHCRLISGEPRLTDHSEVRWCTVAELRELDWAAADIPAVTRIGQGALGGIPV